MTGYISVISQDSPVHGLGLFAVKDIKAGDLIDICCFGSFELYDSESQVEEAIADDGVPRYMVSTDVASMCIGSERSRPAAALFLAPHPCHFLWYMNSCGSDTEKANVERESTFQPTNWSLGKGGGAGGGGAGRRRKLPLWEALKSPPNTLKFRLGRDIVAGEELLHNYDCLLTGASARDLDSDEEMEEEEESGEDSGSNSGWEEEESKEDSGSNSG